eukprot:CAMPEP_0194670918 /NCGR_PEP_ID=MMETSP0295-20121207/5500_1 /TAXON_ID=39354 /ORGANISM="Heterosigma akashiwo, Strain CCMP2393" /LENGTH=274 /DNA_ID=CAMNT_0039554257 /DNA_START=144 /DNA_END=965 /DNA_ORIENTATION=-
MAYRFQKKSGPSKTSVDSYDEDSVTYGGDMSTIYSPPPFEGNMQEAKALFENTNQQQKTDSLYQRIDEYKMKNMELQEALRKLQEEFTTEMDDREKIIKHLRTEYKASSTKAADLQAQLDLTIKSANEKYEKMESKLTRKVHDLEEEVLMKEVELSKLKEFAGIKDELEEEVRTLRAEAAAERRADARRRAAAEQAQTRTEARLQQRLAQDLERREQEIRKELEAAVSAEARSAVQESRACRGELQYQSLQAQAVLAEGARAAAENGRLRRELA